MSSLTQNASSHPASNRSGAPEGGFFRFHGFWAPGVRAMRQLSFKANSIIIVAAILIPIAVLLGDMTVNIARQLDVTRLKRDGLRELQLIVPVLQAEQQHLQLAFAHPGAAPADARDALELATSGLQALSENDTNDGVRLSTADQVRQIIAMNQNLAEHWTTMEPADLQGLHDDLEARLRKLFVNVADNSGLVHDEQTDVYYLANAVVVEGFATLNRVARLQTHTNLRDLERSAATLADSVDRLANAVDRIGQANASARSDLDSDDAQGALLGLVAELDRNVSQGGIPSDHGEEFQGYVTAALQQQFAVNLRGLATLDVLLDERMNTQTRERNLKLGITVSFVLMALYMMVSFLRVTIGGLKVIGDNIVAMADGDFTSRPVPWGRDEVAKSMDSLRNTLITISESIRVIQDRAGDVSIAARQIAAGNQDLSRRTEASVASLDGAMQGIAQLRQAAGDYVTAMNEAQSRIEVMRDFSQVNETAVQGLVDRMNALSAQSRQIAAIVSIIDGIAFQTNILALNASVEAARAGDQGRGFAVVAQEVRALAQRSAEAARQIAGIVSSSTAEIAAGAKLAADAGSAVGRMVEQANDVNARIRSVREDALSNQGVVNSTYEAVEGFASSTRNNASLVDEIAGSTASLDQSGEELHTLVGRFKVQARSFRS